MQQPFLIVFPFFISVFIVRVLPRVILAPVALLVFLLLNWWFDSGIEAGVVDQGPSYKSYIDAKRPRIPFTNTAAW